MPFPEASNTICITSLSTLPSSTIADVLQQGGFQSSIAETAGLRLLLVDTMGDPRIEPINRTCLENDTPLFLLKSGGQAFEYALFTRTSAWWGCFEKRHRLLDGPATYLYQVLQPEQPVIEPQAYTRDRLEIIARWVLIEISNYLQSPDDALLPGTLRSVAMDALTTSSHRVSRIPSCPACGTPEVLAFPDPPLINRQARMVS